MTRVGVVALGGVFESCSLSLWWLFASRRGTAVLWMLCPVVAHLIVRGLQFHTVPFPFRVSDWQHDVFLDISDYPEGKCVFVCICLLSSTHCFSIFFHFSPDSNVFTKKLVTVLGLFNGFYMFHEGAGVHLLNTLANWGKNKVLASISSFIGRVIQSEKTVCKYMSILHIWGHFCSMCR